MTGKIANQRLITVQDDAGGKAVIRRGPKGEGYFLHGDDNELGITFGYFPLTQDEVASAFKDKGLIWRPE